MLVDLIVLAVVVVEIEVAYTCICSSFIGLFKIIVTISIGEKNSCFLTIVLLCPYRSQTDWQ